MSTYDDIASRLPIQQLAAQVGEDPADVERAVHTILPALLGGLQANAADPGGAASLTQALGHHATNVPAEGSIDLGQVDAADGEKIARHVFGDQTDQVINQLGTVGGGSDLISKLLPLLAPLVMAYVGKQLGQGAASGAGSSPGGGALGSILGQILGGATGGSSSSILGGVLGGLLGGGTK
jgi:hypothetical protein